MSDNATSTFPKMGEDIVAGGVVNISGDRSPYTKTVVKQGFGKNDNPPNSQRTHKGSTVIRGAQGPRPTIVAKISYPNSPESGKTTRNVKPLHGPYSREMAAAGTGR